MKHSVRTSKPSNQLRLNRWTSPIKNGARWPSCTTVALIAALKRWRRRWLRWGRRLSGSAIWWARWQPSVTLHSRRVCSTQNMRLISTWWAKKRRSSTWKKWIHSMYSTISQATSTCRRYLRRGCKKFQSALSSKTILMHLRMMCSMMKSENRLSRIWSSRLGRFRLRCKTWTQSPWIKKTISLNSDRSFDWKPRKTALSKSRFACLIMQRRLILIRSRVNLKPTRLWMCSTKIGSPWTQTSAKFSRRCCNRWRKHS